MSGQRYQPEDLARRVWELLRRRARFAKVVARMTTYKTWTEYAVSRDDARCRGIRLRQCLEKRLGNSFAATALVWLVPDPLFHVEEIGLRTRRAEEPEGVDLVVTHRVGLGRTPDETDGSWRWFESGPAHLAGKDRPRDSARSKANASGAFALSWGPDIHTVRSRDPALESRCHDGVGEWRAWQEQHGPFMLRTPWSDVPPGFRRAFTGQWTKLFGHPQAREVKLSAKMLEQLHHELNSGSVSVEGLSLMLILQDLAQQRVFSLPGFIMRRDVGPILAELRRALEAELGDFEPMGPGAYWETLRAVEEIEGKDGVGRGAAIARLVREKHGIPAVHRAAAKHPDTRRLVERWFREGEMLPRPERQREAVSWERANAFVKGVLDEELHQRGGELWRRLKFMDGLIQSVFPRFNVEGLLKRAPTGSAP